jgi:hypothetical protein
MRAGHCLEDTRIRISTLSYPPYILVIFSCIDVISRICHINWKCDMVTRVFACDVLCHHYAYGTVTYRVSYRRRI